MADKLASVEDLRVEDREAGKLIDWLQRRRKRCRIRRQEALVRSETRCWPTLYESVWEISVN